MNLRQRLLTLLALLPAALPAAAQQSPRVVVQRLEDRQLKRIAHIHRVPVEQVRQARQLLAEATGLIENAEFEAGSFPQPDFLASLWVRLDPREAPRRLESLFQITADNAEAAEKLQTYSQHLAWGKSLAGQLAPLDPEGALLLLRSWPAPPVSLDDDARKISEAFRNDLQSESFQELFEVNPAQAILQLGNYSNQRSRFGRAAQRLAYLPHQDSEAVDQVVDEMIEHIRTLPKRSLDPNEYFSFVQQASHRRPDRLRELLMVGLEALPSVGEGADGRLETLLETKHGEEAFGPLEMRVIQLARSLSNRPTLAIELLDALPGVSEKLERLGGLDQGLQARQVGYRSKGKITYFQGNHSDRINVNAGRDLARILDHHALRRPGWVRNQLLRTAETDPSLARLYNVFHQAQHPDVKELCLDILHQSVLEHEDSLSKVRELRRLIQAYKSFEGVPPADLVQAAFTVLGKVRRNLGDDARKARNHSPELGTFEALLMAEWACIDFDSAHSRVLGSRTFEPASCG